MTILSNSRLEWLEHVTRMNGRCIPKQVLYDKLMVDQNWEIHLYTSLSHQCKIFFYQSQGFGRTWERLSNVESDSVQMHSIIWGRHKDQTRNQKMQVQVNHTLQHKYCLLLLWPALQIQHWQSQPWEELFSKMVFGITHNSWHKTDSYPSS